MRFAKLVTSLALVVSLGGPVHAGKVVFGVNLGLTGFVVTQYVDALPSPRSDGATGYSITGQCAFAGALTPANRLNISYGGYVTASGPQVPQLTYIKCAISNAFGETAYAESANGGPVSTVAASVTGWRVAPVTVCIDTFAIYGPTPVVIVSTPTSCQEPGVIGAEA